MLPEICRTASDPCPVPLRDPGFSLGPTFADVADWIDRVRLEGYRHGAFYTAEAIIAWAKSEPDPDGRGNDDVIRWIEFFCKDEEELSDATNFDSLLKQTGGTAAPLDDGEPFGSQQGSVFESLLERLESKITQLQSPQPECLPPIEAAKFLAIELPQLEYLVKTRKIRYIQVGDQRGRVFRIADLRAFLDERTVKTAEEELRRRGRR